MSYIPFAFLYICIIVCMSIVFNPIFISNSLMLGISMIFFSWIWFFFLITKMCTYIIPSPLPNWIYIKMQTKERQLLQKKIKKIEEIIFVQSVGAWFLVNLQTSKHKDKNWPPQYNRNIAECGIQHYHPKPKFKVQDSLTYILHVPDFGLEIHVHF